MTTGSCMPGAATPEEFENALADEPALRRGVRVICERNGIEARSTERFAGGSVPVYALGDALVLKLCPPYAIEERDDESLALVALDGRLPIPTPRVHAVGELDGWGYILMSRLEGVSLADAWPRIGQENRLRLAQSLGESLAALHALRDPRLERFRGDWDGFIERQRGNGMVRQQMRGLDRRWCEQIPGFLETVPLRPCRPDSLLHTEVMREHLLARQGPDGWTLSGLFDFEPAMIGAPEYEFAAVGLFVSCGDPAVLRRVLIAYGYAENQLDAELQNRFLAYTLLHRYSNLPWYLKRVPPPDRVRSLSELASFWWGFADDR
jgi:hygromycin-B 7''-O-kinase